MRYLLRLAAVEPFSKWERGKGNFFVHVPKPNHHFLEHIKKKKDGIGSFPLFENILFGLSFGIVIIVIRSESHKIRRTIKIVITLLL